MVNRRMQYPLLNYIAERNSNPCQTTKKELYSEIAKGFQPFKCYFKIFEWVLNSTLYQVGRKESEKNLLTAVFVVSFE